MMRRCPGSLGSRSQSLLRSVRSSSTLEYNDGRYLNLLKKGVYPDFFAGKSPRELIKGGLPPISSPPASRDAGRFLRHTHSQRIPNMTVPLLTRCELRIGYRLYVENEPREVA